MFSDDILKVLKGIDKVIYDLEVVEDKIGRDLELSIEFNGAEANDYFDDYDGEDHEALLETIDVLKSELEDLVKWAEKRLGV